MKTLIELTFTQCKQIVSNGFDLREAVEQLNDQPYFMSDNTGMQIDSISELKSILLGGCASNAHKSVYCYEASRCMTKHGDHVLEYIDNLMGELPTIPSGSSWTQLGSFYLSCAIELWCGQFEEMLEGVYWD